MPPIPAKQPLGVFPSRITDLAIDPVTPTTLYTYFASGVQSGVYRSTDGAATWTFASTSGLPYNPSASLAVDPRSTTTLYAQTFSSAQLFKSTDGGTTWTDLQVVAPRSFGIVVDPSNSSSLYMGGVDQVYHSTDGGTTWPASVAGPGTGVIFGAPAIDPNASSTLYALGEDSATTTLVKSTDGGGTWTTLALPAGANGAPCLAIDPATSSTIYLGLAPSGAVSPTLLKSTDGGQTWTDLSGGLPQPGSAVRALAIDPTAHLTIYAGVAAPETVAKSTTGGQ